MLNRKNVGTWSKAFPERENGNGFRANTQTVYEYLKEHGASFFVDIVSGTNLLSSVVEEALGELVFRGLVSADSFTGLRALLTPLSKSTHREVETIDGYLSEATHGIQGTAERLERLMPQQSRVIQLDPLPQDATVEIVAVVLDDGTAIGEESAIAPIFERRARERDALTAVAAVFSDVLSSQHGTAALDSLKQRLVALPARDEVPCRAAIDAVDTYRQRGGARTPDQIDESLRTYAAFVGREAELAKQHAQRKNR